MVHFGNPFGLPLKILGNVNAQIHLVVLSSD